MVALAPGIHLRYPSHPTHEQVNRSPPEISWSKRLSMFLGGMVLIVPLITAMTLQPDDRGFGTHEQLGLKPCWFREKLAMRCPSCGMTTSWAWAVRGRLIRSLQTNVGGTLLAVVAVVLGPWSIAVAARGRWMLVRPSPERTAVTCVIVVGVVTIDWVTRLVLGI